MRDHVLWALPYPMKIVVGLLIYRGTMKTLHGQGTGRYSDDEIRSFRLEIWEGINALLARSRKTATSNTDGKPFWVLGDENPTEADASLFAFIISVLTCTA